MVWVGSAVLRGGGGPGEFANHALEVFREQFRAFFAEDLRDFTVIPEGAFAAALEALPDRFAVAAKIGEQT